MNGELLFPDSRGRSATAVPGKASVRDEHVYSSLVLAHGGTGQQKIFTNPQGQTIPSLKGSAITLTAAWHTTYTEVSTNLTQAGQLGNALGDAAIKSIGISLEQAAFHPTTGAITTEGASAYEAVDIGKKVFFQFKNSSAIETQGPIWAYPAAGGMFGAVTSTLASVSPSLVMNGPNAIPRKLRLPILVSRTDNLEGVVGVAGASTLAFSTTTGEGQATLLTVMLNVLTKRDVR